MRYKLTLHTDTTLTVPIDHNLLLQSLVYEILEIGKPEHAQWLRRSGYQVGNKYVRHRKPASYKMFTFSSLRVPQSRRTVSQFELVIAPGSMEWLVSSPMLEFAAALEAGIKNTKEVWIGGQKVHLQKMERDVPPKFDAVEAFTCICPVVMTRHVPQEDSGWRYLFPEEAGEWNLPLFENLLSKYCILYGGPDRESDPDQSEEEVLFEPFEIQWDAAYLERSHNHGVKKVTLSMHPHKVVYGCQSPFVLRASPKLMRIAYECGLGEYNGAGLGMIAPIKSRLF